MVTVLDVIETLKLQVNYQYRIYFMCDHKKLVASFNDPLKNHYIKVESDN